MAYISASTVMDLRQRTGLGMMECKKALAEVGGDLAKAEELLRIRSGAKASKAAARIAAEGIVGAYLASDGALGLWGLDSGKPYSTSGYGVVATVVFKQRKCDYNATHSSVSSEE